MTEITELYTMVGWEDRALLGLDRILDEHPIARVTAFFGKDYAERTEAFRILYAEKVSARRAVVDFIEVDIREPLKLRGIMKASVTQSVHANASAALLDISVMPREIVWYLLDEFAISVPSLRVVYHAPEAYGDWLTQSPSEPRLVLNHSGIAFPDLPTCIICFVGTEYSRIEKLVHRFEAKKIILLNDPDAELYGHSENNIDENYFSTVENIVFDNKDFSTECIERFVKIVRDCTPDFNVVMSNFGPKPSSLLLYIANRRVHEAGIVYVPSSKYNIEYSKGIGRTYFFDVPLS